MNRVMTSEEKQKVLQRVKPVGKWQAPPVREVPFGNPPVLWEEQIGDLDEWRQHQGEARKILPLLANKAKTDSVCNSIRNRLNKLFEKESWAVFPQTGGTPQTDGIFLRFNGAKSTRERKNRQRTAGSASDAAEEGDGLFATG